jgi:hypothetical protein
VIKRAGCAERLADARASIAGPGPLMATISYIDNERSRIMMSGNREAALGTFVPP